MIRIYIFADSHKHFTQAVDEYIKRLGKQIDVIELQPIKKWTPEQIILTESKILHDRLKKERGYKILMSPTGKNLSTWELRSMIESQKNAGNKIIIAIGGANGLDYSLLKDTIDMELSLGKMIFPHSLAFVMTLEQIYRCNEIERGSGYHK